MIVVCIAVIFAVQTAFPVAAAQTDHIFEIFTEGRTDFYAGLEFGDNDWAALCRIRLYGTAGADEYLDSVEEHSLQLMETDGFVKPTDLQRAALILSAAGRCSDELINAAVYYNDRLERQGLNAYIWALIAANCSAYDAPADAVNTKETLVEYLLSRQLEDGGFSLKGTAADTDITAAVIYSLAPLKDTRGVQEALTEAETCLRLMQLENGGYTSMGIENSESAAQAVIAFTALGYHADDKSLSLALTALEAYRTKDGYSHLPDGDTNGTATVQALLALTATELSERGEMLYGRTDIPIAAPDTAEDSRENTSDSTEGISAPPDDDSGITGDGLKYIMGGILLMSGVVLGIVLLLRKKRSQLILPALLLSAGVIVLLVDIRMPAEYYAASQDGTMSVTVSADFSAAIGYGYDTADDIMLQEQTVMLHEGATAFDALIEAAKPAQLRIDYTGSAFGEYVTGIGGLSEFDCGSESGWLYTVNGEYPSVSSGAYTLSEGDRVEFVYTVSLGTYRG